MTEKVKNKPIQVRLGRVKANIWENETENGTFFNVTFARLYTEGGDKKKKPVWKESTSFGRDDLLLLAKVVDLAHTRITERATESSE